MRRALTTTANSVFQSKGTRQQPFDGDLVNAKPTTPIATWEAGTSADNSRLTKLPPFLINDNSALHEYKKALKKAPHSINLLKKVGLWYQRKGDFAVAIKYFSRAVTIDSSAFELQINIADSLNSLSRHAEAIDHYKQALRLGCNLHSTYHNLGCSYAAIHEFSLAIQSYNRALELDSKNPSTYNCIGSSHQQLGQFDTAMAAYLKAIEFNPYFAEAHFNIAILFLREGRHEEAAGGFRYAGELNPQLSKSFLHLGNLLKAANHLDEAVVEIRKSIKIEPSSHDAYSDLGSVYNAMGDYRLAIECFKKSLALQPNYIPALVNISNPLKATGDLNGAIQALNLALSIDSACAEAHFNLSLIELSLGEFRSGWARYEWRLQTKGHEVPLFAKAVPEWSGHNLNGQRILLYSEQGLGDTIQFLRYIPLVLQLNAIVVLKVPATLQRLARTISDAIEVITEGDPIPPVAWQRSLVSLPLVFDTTLSTVPNEFAYLAPPLEARTKCDSVEWLKNGLNIGLVWAGSSGNSRDRVRSIPLTKFAKIALHPAANFYCLQFGAVAAEWAEDQLPLIDVGPIITDMADTAAIICKLDLVITVDTAVAHLAGTLGKKVWILLPSDSDFRWLRDRLDSPWYKSATLFRQQHLNDWDKVVNDVVDAIGRLVSCKGNPQSKHTYTLD